MDTQDWKLLLPFMILFRKEPDPGRWENVQEQELGSWSCDCPMGVGLCQGRRPGRQSKQPAAWHFLAGVVKTRFIAEAKGCGKTEQD